MIRDLTIENYRLFRHFQMDNIARVNLIVGDNNSGKSSLLEAVYLLTVEGNPNPLFQSLHSRREFILQIADIEGEPKTINQGYEISHLFNGHKLSKERSIRISSSVKRSRNLTVYLADRNGQNDDDKQMKLFEDAELGSELSPAPILAVKYQSPGSEEKHYTVPLSVDGMCFPSRQLFRTSFPLSVFFLTTQQFEYRQLAEMWDQITLTPKEDRVVEALRILEPDIERISFTSRQTSGMGILVKRRMETDPVPMGSMGDGMKRLLGLAVSLVNVENGTMLIDEIDTGLHYRALCDMWKLVIETAQRLDVQVFATTHSWDCVVAFQEALEQHISSNGDNVGQLIRLDKRGDEIKATSYSADELTVAVEHEIEVR